MKLRHYFDPKRFWLLLKLEFTRNCRGIAMLFFITFGLLFFVGFMLSLMVEGSIKTFEHHTDYTSSLLIGGFILTSLAFHDLGNPLKRSGYFTLPVSAFEKFLCMWLLTSLGWIVLFTIAYSFYALAANPIGEMVFRNVKFESFNPLGDSALSAMKYYFVLQGVFLVGAAHFRGYAFAKTVFVLLVFVMFFVIVFYFTLLDVFMTEHDCTGYDCELLPEIGNQPIWRVLMIFFWWILAPLCWVIGYLGIKEQEV
jgi:hypothetical protein